MRQPSLAYAMNVANKVQDLQARLSRAAKQSLDRKFGALYDKMYRRDVLMEAWKRVRANKGAPGIDEQDFECIEHWHKAKAASKPSPPHLHPMHNGSTLLAREAE